MLRVNKNLCLFSPAGMCVAYAYKQELIIKDIVTFRTIQLYEFGVDNIEYIEWTSNGQYILCAHFKKAIVQVFSLKHTKWKCKLTGGSAGFERVFWSPDDKSILLVSDLNVELSIWSLDTQKIIDVWNLKSSAANITLDKNAQRIAIIASDNGVDSIEIYQTEDNWKLSKKLLCDKLYGIDGVSWSPNGELLAIWCSTIGKSRLLIYSAVNDAHIGVFDGENTDNNLLRTVSGIKTVIWSTNGKLLAVVGYNETVAIINYITWSVLAQLYCDPVVNEDHYFDRVFKEVDVIQKNSFNNICSDSIPKLQLQEWTLQEINERPFNITIDVKPPTSRDISIASIDMLEFSPCGKFLALRHQLYPTTLWIWDLLENSTDYIILKNIITGIAWSPLQKRLLIMSESSLIVEWKYNSEIKCFRTAQAMKIVKATWHDDGQVLLLFGYNKVLLTRLEDCS